MSIKNFEEMGKKRFLMWNDAINEIMGSFRSNEIVLLHWASKNWKSMYTMSIANQNWMNWIKTAYFSLEMDKETLKMQQSCIRAWIDRKTFEEASYTDKQWASYCNHFEWFERNFTLYDEVDFMWENSIDNVVKKIQELHLQEWVDLFIIDSLKLIKWKPSWGSDNARDNMCITRLKELKNKLPICIILIHHNIKDWSNFSWWQDLENFSDWRIMIKKNLDENADWIKYFHQTEITIHKERLWKEMEFLFNFDKWNLIYLPKAKSY